ncbi:c-type cytochrome [Bremerella sp. JC817]|uniref:c-type cytochrome n=1 Tax=Bremerella sp. JC817 TaxID=3231756 RepID=UPI003457E25E
MRPIISALTIALAWFFAPASVVLAQFEEDFAPGLITTIQATDGTRCVRIDPTVSFDWGKASPDLRISEGKFSARWDGLLLSRTSGDYTIYAYVCGKVRVQLEDQVVLEANTTTPQWVTGKPLSMKFDWHPFQVDFARTQPNAELKLFWSGPDFPLEPIPAEYFYHDIDKTIEQPFERGRELIAGYRCTACHDVQQQQLAAKAPSLAQLDGNLSEPWLREWLASKPAEEDSDTLRRMPHFELSNDDVDAVVEYLLSESKPREKKSELPTKGSAPSGKNLVLTLGCTACHTIGELGTASVMGGPDLTNIAAKRPRGFFQTWLADPAKLNPDHRMPVYDLNDKQRDDISSYLATLTEDKTLAQTPVRQFNPLLIEQGRKLIADNRCQSCHTLPGDAAKQVHPSLPKLGPGNLWQDACMGSPVAAKGQPGYQLPESDREAIKTYIREVARAKQSPQASADAAWILKENNCLACHPRGTGKGLSETAKEVVDAHSGLTSLLPSMVPPSLNSVGDKLHDQALLAAIRRSGGNHRPWLRVQMPKFDLTAEEQQALVNHFVAQDRIPEKAPAIPTIPEVEGLAATIAGSRLVTTDGFGCTSCHQVGQMIPPKAPLNAKGPDLSMLGDRIREPWFYRWVHDPARIVPRMEMPSVKLPVQGVLDNQVDTQLAAVWHVLNTPDFTPPKPDPVRIVRQTGAKSATDRAIVLTDVIKLADKKVLIKPLLVGLPNRNNVLYDLESASLYQWWVGDVARQRSEGKTWHWEIGGRGLFDPTSPVPEIVLRDGDDNPISPRRDGQFFTRFGEIDYDGDALTWTQTLHFGTSDPIDLEVRQTLTPLWTKEGSPRNGFTRSITVTNLPEGYSIGLRLPRETLAGPVQLAGQVDDQIQFSSGDMLIALDHAETLSPDAGQLVWLAANEKNLTATYSLRLPGETIAAAAALPPQLSKAVDLDIIPGWSATRLPITTEMMSIAMDWQPDGSLMAASLKGRIWKLTDTDGDGLEDTYRQFGDEYAAPYGLKAHGKYVDIVNKYALLRLWDEDGDGIVEKVTNLSNGWGHTDDYHDWVVGLPQDADGNYYAAIPCQQDGRSKEAARLRGTVVKLTPTSDDPHKQTYRIEELTAGHRFPMGIARNHQGELFVTDNQGNWNPFNELNHVVPGLRYGFINAVDRKPGFAPPETPPSIAIPHPWTRSVNGICFLETPADVREKLGYDLFGPWEGDLVGCEYDTRRLVRMSLEKVGDTIQGAAYPLTVDPPQDVEKGLLGPISCAVAPDGDLYVSNLRDAGWGGGNNVGTFTRLRPNSVHLPLGIDEVRATPTGFKIRFTDQIDAGYGNLASNYSIASYTRTSTPAYGGDDQQRRLESVASVVVSEDRLEATVTLEAPIREGFVYELFLDDEIAGPGKTLWPKEAHYTMRKVREN